MYFAYTLYKKNGVKRENAGINRISEKKEKKYTYKFNIDRSCLPSPLSQFSLASV